MKLPGAVSVVCVSFAVLGYVATALTAVEPLCNNLGWQLWWFASLFGASEGHQSKLALSKT